ncbi:GNAT family N-acetyltransferase [Actinopolymorpha singaporensis]
MSGVSSANLVALNGDFARVLARWVRSRMDATLFAGASFPWPVSADAFLAMTQEPGRDVRVLLDTEDQPVATGSILITSQECARIGRVLVDPARRGEGFGRSIMQALIEEVSARPHVRLIRLGVYQRNAAARALYESLGFKATQKPGRTAVVDEEKWPSVEMQRAVRADQGTRSSADPRPSLGRP